MTDWTTELRLSGKEQEPFIDRGKKIVKRYRDERGRSSKERKYNILWSNVRTMFPAVYARKPQAQVERRYKDADPVGRTAGEILERALQFEIDQYPDYDSALKGVVLDRLLPGRGVAWIIFEKPEEPQAAPEGDADENPADQEHAEDPSVDEQLSDDVTDGKYEKAGVDYVYWEDFRHSRARTWEEVTWVARRTYLTMAEGTKRFGNVFKTAPMTHMPVGMEKSQITDDMKKAVVWEIWDKTTKRVIWWCEGMPKALDEKPDLYRLDGFFPCPKPLFATMTTDTLIPVPDYHEYQDQAIEIDDLTARIGLLVDAVKVVGVYDASQTAVQRMLSEGCENKMIPVDTWAAFAEKGGMKGVVDFLPLDMVVAALAQLYASREAAKQVIYEVTGLSDIIRGASIASETATAQQIKSQYASLRLKESQQDVARFATDILNMKAQLMCLMYSDETLLAMSGIEQTGDQENAQAAIALLRDERTRNYRIEIAADSMVEMDEQAEKQARLEFLSAAGGFIQQAVGAPPELAPLLGEMLMFGVRAFKAGRPIEGAFETAMEQLKAPKQPQPNPEMLKLQADQQMAQQKAQADQQLAQAQIQADLQIQQARIQAEREVQTMKLQAEQEMARLRMQMDVEIDRGKALMQMEFDRWKVELEQATKIEVANISSKAKVENAATDAATKEIASEVTQ